MNVAIYCKDRKDWAARAIASAKEVFGDSSVSRIDLIDTVAVDELRKHWLVVAHLSADQWRTLASGSLDSVNAIVRVSSVGVGGLDGSKTVYRLNQNGPWVLCLADEVDKVNEEKWHQLFSALKNWDTRDSEIPTDLASIFGHGTEALFALRLLCEAWLMNAGKKEKPHGDIMIHAPVSPSDWFAPFDENHATPDAAVRIAKVTGKAQKEAENFLKKLAELAQEGKDLQGPDAENSVRQLQAALKAEMII